MSDLAAIQGWLSSVQSTMSGLPSQVQQAAATGDFASVFSEAQSVLSGGPGTLGGAAGTVASPPGSVGSTAPAAGASFGAYAPSGAALVGTGSAALPSGATGSAAVATAEKYLGTPYVWGGATPSGFDCSGLVQYVYAQLGVSLPRTSEQQATAGAPVASLAQAQPGDLVFYAGSDGTASSPGHVGIYVGNGEMVDAPQTGSVVSLQPVGAPVAIRRVVPAAAPTSPATGGAANTAVPSALAPVFAAASARYGISQSLLEAVAQVESGFNPYAVSSAGAQGLMQIMPATAAGIGVNPFDPAQAIYGAAQLLSGYLAQYGGSTSLALAAYNAGPAAVAQYGGVPPFPQTATYIQAVTTIAGGGS
ncbi:MAG TPA: NlpC/P60 family protein [Acidimicrobiales bacterium]|nr:NlpC/P60 family protein [Acidimicrobiales bacterium]HVC24637.1 NlpC/P60 family protein [Acidimicrobiales bacterium]